ncbi:MAG: hypothetical protein ACTSX7_00130 [Alphaproteobacteria bacterium]
MLRSHMHHPAMAADYAVRFDPGTAAIAIASAVVGAVDDARQGAADRKSAEFQARLLEQEAERQTQDGKEDATRLRRKGSQISARQRAVLAGSGLAQSGTPLLVLADTAAETERQATLALSGAGSTRTRQQAALKRRQGLNSQNTSFFRAGQSLLSKADSFRDVLLNGPFA